MQFTETQRVGTDKNLCIYNGNVGTITGIDVHIGQLTARLDSGRAVLWSAGEFQDFRHATRLIYKGQTLDHTYLYHIFIPTEHWRAAAASCVAPTKQRESTQVFVARETAGDLGSSRSRSRGAR